MDTIQFPELFQLANTLYRRGLNDEEVTLQLKEKGAADSTLTDIIRQVKKWRIAKRRNAGFLFCGIGVFLLVAGCMLALFLFSSGSDVKFALYGLTIIGIVFTLKGLVDLLGW